MNGLVGHREDTLGTIDVGWKDADGSVWPFYVLRFSGGPIDNNVTYCTLGLSDTPLRSPAAGRQIRHELLLMARPAFTDRNIPAILHQMGAEAIATGRPYLRGDVIGPRGTLIASTEMQALYVTSPAYLPESFATYQSPEGVSCVIAWLIPVTAREAALVRTDGWEAFEDRLCVADPDLLNLGRPSIV